MKTFTKIFAILAFTVLSASSAFGEKGAREEPNAIVKAILAYDKAYCKPVTYKCHIVPGGVLSVAIGAAGYLAIGSTLPLILPLWAAPLGIAIVPGLVRSFQIDPQVFMNMLATGPAAAA